MILAGDVGGTKTVLALYALDAGRLVERQREVFPSREHAGLGEILEKFLASHRGARIQAAGFGVAGVVEDGRVAATNLPWVTQASELAGALGLPGVALLNDLEAAAYGMLELGPEALVELNPGAAEPEPRAHAAVIAPGTGLGQAALVWDGRRHRAVASEGGHADFAPRSDEQIELLHFLRAELGRVSVERVLSGPGLHNLYRFLRAQSGVPEPDTLRERLAHEDPGAVIGELGLHGDEPVCARSVALFAAIYGGEAGDLALRLLPHRGVYLGGGITPRLLPVLRRGGFLEAFRAKGRFSERVGRFPVLASLEPAAPLLGAAREAAREAEVGGSGRP
jgi:glucokinase